MSRFEDCVNFVLAREGGVSNDPDDPGGLTVYGLSSRYHPELFADGHPSQEAAKQVYFKDYWEASGADKLPPPYDFLVFDAAVNQGRFVAVQILQKALGIDVDGRVGPQTIAACHSAGKEMPARVLAYRAYRYSQTNGFAKFGIGWLTRTYLLAIETAKH